MDADDHLTFTIFLALMTADTSHRSAAGQIGAYDEDVTDSHRISLAV
ncbi:MAG: hypothetical protein HC834_00880 [Rhodospirillales bacterium]|nr:hypothetical protein [Rhodospirillales bacterium]